MFRALALILQAAIEGSKHIGRLRHENQNRLLINIYMTCVTCQLC